MPTRALIRLAALALVLSGQLAGSASAAVPTTPAPTTPLTPPVRSAALELAGDAVVSESVGPYAEAWVDANGSTELGDGPLLGANTGITITNGFLRCNAYGGACSAIVGATGWSYVLRTADVGHTIRVSQYATNAAGRSASMLSEASAVVRSAVPVAVGPLAPFGRAIVGERVGAYNGGWIGATTTRQSYLRCDATGDACLPIPGASAWTYAVQITDIAHTIRVRVQATNAAGSSAIQTSEPSAVVPRYVPPAPGPTATTPTPTPTGSAPGLLPTTPRPLEPLPTTPPALPDTPVPATSPPATSPAGAGPTMPAGPAPEVSAVTAHAGPSSPSSSPSSSPAPGAGSAVGASSGPGPAALIAPATIVGAELRLRALPLALKRGEQCPSSVLVKVSSGSTQRTQRVKVSGACAITGSLALTGRLRTAATLRLTTSGKGLKTAKRTVRR